MFGSTILTSNLYIHQTCVCLVFVKMSFNTNWNVDLHKENTESDLQWHLRKSFLQVHKKNIPEDRLAAYSKVFENMEFKGCIYGSIYNTQCMTLVQYLAEQVPEIIQYWEDKKSNVSKISAITFETVKVKTLNGDNENEQQISMSGIFAKAYEDGLRKLKVVRQDILHKLLKTNWETTVFEVCNIMTTSSKSRENETINYIVPSTVVKVSNTDQKSSSNEKKRKINFVKCRESNVEMSPIKKSRTECIQPTITIEAGIELYKKVRSQSGIKGKLVIFDNYDTDKEILFQSAAILRVDLQYRTVPLPKTNIRNVQIVSYGEIIAEVEHMKKVKLHEKTKLASAALQELKKYCFSITPKDNAYQSVDIQNIDPNSDFLPKISANLKSGIGAKIMMQQMGWKGTGLGRDETGIKTPIEVAPRVGRTLGFGHHEITDKRDIINKFRIYLTKYKSSEDKRMLQFPCSLNCEQKKSIKAMIRKMSLNVRFVEDDKNKFVRIWKNFNLWTVVEELITKGGSSDIYTLIYPTDIQ